MLHPEHELLSNKLLDIELSVEYIDFLCGKTADKRLNWEIRFKYLRVLLINKSVCNFNLKQFFFDLQKESRRLAFKIFLIRGYVLYATEDEIGVVMDKFSASMKKCMDYIDYEYILSVPALPYLVRTYNYKCLFDALDFTKQRFSTVNPYLQDLFTLNEDMQTFNLVTPEEAKERMKLFLENIKPKADG